MKNLIFSEEHPDWAVRKFSRNSARPQKPLIKPPGLQHAILKRSRKVTITRKRRVSLRAIFSRRVSASGWTRTTWTINLNFERMKKSGKSKFYNLFCFWINIMLSCFIYVRGYILFSHILGSKIWIFNPILGPKFILEPNLEPFLVLKIYFWARKIKTWLFITHKL